jgi:anti-sigma factor RsiW
MSTTKTFTDEDLVAYSDGALDAARANEVKVALEHDACLAARFGALEFDRRAVSASFEAMADTAPIDFLRVQIRNQPGHAHFSFGAGSQWLRIAAALIAGLCIGWGVTRISKDPTEDWRVAVANYQRLYTTATLSRITSDGGIERDEVATVADKLGLPIKLEQLQLADLKFKRAQLLEFDGRLLAQFAYLDSQGAPISFCATRSNAPNSLVRVGTIGGLSAASWDKYGYSFIVIGAAPAEALRQAASALLEAI